MAATDKVEVVVVGSVGIDAVKTRDSERENLLGGSVSYACAASSFFTKTGMVGVVGTDFPKVHRDVYDHFGIDTAGLESCEGNTFRWAGVYDDDMINRETLLTELGVFADFAPTIPEAYTHAPYLLLGNIAPALQLRVLEQAPEAKFVLVDTMDLWINIAADELREVIKHADMLMLNDAEARLLTGRYHLRQCAAELVRMGPAFVVIKKGEHGAMLFSRDGIFIVPAYPVEEVYDPTGAGDTFAGAFLGRLSQLGEVTQGTIRQALLCGSTVASFNVEAFSLDRLENLTDEEIQARYDELAEMVRI